MVMKKIYKTYSAFKWTVLAIIFMSVGWLVSNDVSAYEEELFQGATGYYQFTGVLDDAALITRLNGVEGMGIVDMHGTTIKIIQYPECMQLIIDVPSLGPSILQCVENTINE